MYPSLAVRFLRGERIVSPSGLADVAFADGRACTFAHLARAIDDIRFQQYRSVPPPARATVELPSVSARA